MRELTKLEKAIVFLDSIEGLEYKYKKFFIDNYNGEILGNAQGVYEFFKEHNAEVMGKSISEMLKDEKFVEKRIETALRGADDISLKLSARARSRIIKVARTIADMELSEQIESKHLLEAISYRGEEL